MQIKVSRQLAEELSKKNTGIKVARASDTALSTNSKNTSDNSNNTQNKINIQYTPSEIYDLDSIIESIRRNNKDKPLFLKINMDDGNDVEVLNNILALLAHDNNIDISYKPESVELSEYLAEQIPSFEQKYSKYIEKYYQLYLNQKSSILEGFISLDTVIANIDLNHDTYAKLLGNKKTVEAVYGNQDAANQKDLVEWGLNTHGTDKSNTYFRIDSEFDADSSNPIANWVLTEKINELEGSINSVTENPEYSKFVLKEDQTKIDSQQNSDILDLENTVNDIVSKIPSGGYVVDSELSTSSINPIQNSTVTAALNNRIDTQTFYQELSNYVLVNTFTTGLSKKQDILTDSGENQNIKTINGESILGSGDIKVSIPTASSSEIGGIKISDNFEIDENGILSINSNYVDNELSEDSPNPVQNKVIFEELNTKYTLGTDLDLQNKNIENVNTINSHALPSGSDELLTETTANNIYLRVDGDNTLENNLNLQDLSVIFNNSSISGDSENINIINGNKSIKLSSKNISDNSEYTYYYPNKSGTFVLSDDIANFITESDIPELSAKSAVDDTQNIKAITRLDITGYSITPYVREFIPNGGYDNVSGNYTFKGNIVITGELTNSLDQKYVTKDYVDSKTSENALHRFQGSVYDLEDLYTIPAGNLQNGDTYAVINENNENYSYIGDGTSNTAELWDNIGNLFDIQIDSELSEDSPNPVQNSVLYKKFSSIENTISGYSDDIDLINTNITSINEDISEINGKFLEYLPLDGGNITGQVSFDGDLGINIGEVHLTSSGLQELETQAEKIPGIINNIGDISELQTNIKDNIVNAINELNSKEYNQFEKFKEQSVSALGVNFDIIAHNKPDSGTAAFAFGELDNNLFNGVAVWNDSIFIGSPIDISSSSLDSEENRFILIEDEFTAKIPGMTVQSYGKVSGEYKFDIEYDITDDKKYNLSFYKDKIYSSEYGTFKFPTITEPEIVDSSKYFAVTGNPNGKLVEANPADSSESAENLTSVKIDDTTYKIRSISPFEVKDITTGEDESSITYNAISTNSENIFIGNSHTLSDGGLSLELLTGMQSINYLEQARVFSTGIILKNSPVLCCGLSTIESSDGITVALQSFDSLLVDMRPRSVTLDRSGVHLSVDTGGGGTSLDLGNGISAKSTFTTDCYYTGFDFCYSNSPEDVTSEFYISKPGASVSDRYKLRYVIPHTSEMFEEDQNITKYFALTDNSDGSISLPSNTVTTDTAQTITGVKTFENGLITNKIGSGAQVGTSSLAFGSNADASGNQSVSIGSSSRATGLQSVAVGENARSGGDSSIAIGRFAIASGDQTTAVGYSADATEGGAFAAGSSAEAGSVSATAIGTHAQAYERDAIAIGCESVEGIGNFVSFDYEGHGASTDRNRTLDLAYPSNIFFRNERIKLSAKSTSDYANGKTLQDYLDEKASIDQLSEYTKLPALPSDSDTSNYVLKSIKGTLTWVKESNTIPVLSSVPMEITDDTPALFLVPNGDGTYSHYAIIETDDSGTSDKTAVKVV